MQAFGQALGLLFFAVAVGWVLLLLILQHRLYSAYIARYGDRRRWWQRWISLPPDGSWWHGAFYVRRYDDPVVERLRRRILLAWFVPFGIISVLVVLAVFGELSSR